MADAPYIKWFSNDFAADIADLKGDEIGVFAVIRNLMAQRDGPIEDDASWIARRSGVSTRRFNQIRARLIQLEVIEARAGLLAHPATLREIQRRTAKTQQARSAAMSRWHSANEPELPLRNGSGDPPPRAPAHGADAKPEIKPGKNSDSHEDKNDLISRKKGNKPQKTANPDDADAFPYARARQSQNLESRIPSHPNPVPLNGSAAAAAEPPLRPRDPVLQAKFEAVCSAAGFRSASAEQAERAMKFVEGWHKAGISFDEIVLPTIRSAIAENLHGPGHTRTLGRFDAAVRHAHARTAASASTGRGNPNPTAPVGPDHPDPRFIEWRTTLRRDCGPRTYDGWLKPIRFDLNGDTVTAQLPSQFMADWVTTHFRERLEAMATASGFAGLRITKAPP